MYPHNPPTTCYHLALNAYFNIPHLLFRVIIWICMMVSKVFFFFFFAVPTLALLMTDVQKASTFSRIAYDVRFASAGSRWLEYSSCFPFYFLCLCWNSCYIRYVCCFE
ncbi:uncharacterized protein LOC131310484 [Rhododendron vialii]|uniref:uncharacterized protein LOC131310484 n=1 Tax=Rhododendron vialii TaxID=182163 RepID=UPI00265FC6C4|nr:uncharacterized protein LOC131310484 [Rhododendron vialii]